MAWMPNWTQWNRWRPEMHNVGADEAEALLQAVDALEAGLSFYVDARQPLPALSKPEHGQKQCVRQLWSAPSLASTKP